MSKTFFIINQSLRILLLLRQSQSPGSVHPPDTLLQLHTLHTPCSLQFLLSLTLLLLSLLPFFLLLSLTCYSVYSYTPAISKSGIGPSARHAAPTAHAAHPLFSTIFAFSTFTSSLSFAILLSPFFNLLLRILLPLRQSQSPGSVHPPDTLLQLHMLHTLCSLQFSLSPLLLLLSLLPFFFLLSLACYSIYSYHSGNLKIRIGPSARHAAPTAHAAHPLFSTIFAFSHFYFFSLFAILLSPFLLSLTCYSVYSYHSGNLKVRDWSIRQTRCSNCTCCTPLFSTIFAFSIYAPPFFL